MFRSTFLILFLLLSQSLPAAMELFFLLRFDRSRQSPQIQSVAHLIEVSVRVKTIDRQV